MPPKQAPIREGLSAFNALLSTAAGKAAALVVGVLLLATIVGLVTLWPGDVSENFNNSVVRESEKARVTAVSREGCEQFAGPGCRLVAIELLSGPNEGEPSSLTMPNDPLSPQIDVGSRIRVASNTPGGIDSDVADQMPIDQPGLQPYAFVDFEREAPLTLFVAIFAALVIALGRLRGALALVGLGASLFVLVEFVVPAILDDGPAVPIALTGASAVMLVTLGVTHGLGAKSMAAMLGTAASLALTTLLAIAGVELAQITGFSSEEATLLLGGRPGLSLEGLVLAGMVIGALGVLDDLTVSQASTVMALRRAHPGQSWRELYRGALGVGRDHFSATVNTLVLAYAGAALPVLLIFANQGTSFGEAVNREPVAVEIVGMLVGSIGLIAAVPITTALAALLALRLPDAALGRTDEGHAH